MGIKGSSTGVYFSVVIFTTGMISLGTAVFAGEWQCSEGGKDFLSFTFSFLF